MKERERDLFIAIHTLPGLPPLTFPPPFEACFGCGRASLKRSFAAAISRAVRRAELKTARDK